MLRSVKNVSHQFSRSIMNYKSLLASRIRVEKFVYREISRFEIILARRALQPPSANRILEAFHESTSER